MNKLLKRIEKLETLTARLEQSIVEIRNSCLCLADDLDGGGFNCEPPTCENCRQFNCVCEPELPEKEPTNCFEPEDNCSFCGGYPCICDDVEETEESIKDEDHD
jgi:hypothetical protein